MQLEIAETEKRHEGNLFALSRKIFHQDIRGEDHWIWSMRPEQFRFVIYLIGIANYKTSTVATKSGKKLEIRRGQILCGYDSLSRKTGLSRRTVRGTLEGLERRGFLTRKSAPHGTVLTLCNYGQYQFGENESGTPSGTQSGTPSGTQSVTPRAPSKNVRQKTEDKSTTSSKAGASDGRSSGISPGRFDAAYKHYPRKQGKVKGIAKAKTTIKTEAEFLRFGQCIMAMEKAWSGFVLDKCPHFSSFVNQRRWEDEVPPLPSADTPRKAGPLPAGSITNNRPRKLLPSEIDAARKAKEPR